jgi:hypothetical protein
MVVHISNYLFGRQNKVVSLNEPKVLLPPKTELHYQV